MENRTRVAAMAFAIVATAAALTVFGLWWRQRLPVVQAPEPSASRPVASVAVPPPTPAASAPTVRYPIEAAASEPPAKAATDAAAALDELFGHKAAQSMFQAEDFARRFVATIDNLGRAQAPTRMWPMNPTAGRFIVDAHGEAAISADNGLRYTPYVLLIETVDLRRAVALYAQIYPQFQQAYQDLGYPNRYFNDRFVEVIDLLLVTPDLDTAPKVHLPAINSPVQPPRPWVLYEFDDPALESLASGQKILLRMGAVNERRVKAKLGELRRLLTSGNPPR